MRLQIGIIFRLTVSVQRLSEELSTICMQGSSINQ